MTPDTLSSIPNSSSICVQCYSNYGRIARHYGETTFLSFWIMYFFNLSSSFAVLRSLGCFSHTTVISRHHTYRQAYSLTLSPSTKLVAPVPSMRATVGTTVCVRELFANYPVRQLSFRSNRQSELTELHMVTVGFALSSPVNVTVREGSNNTIIKIERSDAEDWIPVILERGLSCTLSSTTTHEKQIDNVHLNLRGWLANTPRNYTFICTKLS